MAVKRPSSAKRIETKRPAGNHDGETRAPGQARGARSPEEEEGGGEDLDQVVSILGEMDIEV
jgi:hypothetical protein